jgi:hypothetical protein
MPKPKAKPLHYSLKLIEEEKRRVQARTQHRIAQLVMATTTQPQIQENANTDSTADSDSRCNITMAFCLFILMLYTALNLDKIYS